MKQVDIKTRVIPNKPRSGNYPVGSTVVRGGSSGGDTTIINQGGADLSTLRQQFLSKKSDDTANGIIDFLKGLKIASSVIKSVLKKDDQGDLTDEAIMSALRVIQEIENKIKELNDKFIRKDQEDQTEFLVKFLNGIEIGKFVSGLLGTGGAIQIDQDGNSHAEFDYLTIRKLAIFIELIIQEAKHVGGMLIVSPSGMTISKVEETDTAYRCYFERTDGDRTLQNQFTVGTQARRQTFNLTSQAYYWRLVTAVGDDYVDLSKTDCDTGSTIPQAGDELVGLGHRTDKTRQSAIIISAFGSNSPSIMYYQGVDSYSLEDKAVKMDYYDPVSGRYKSVVYGDTYIGLPDESSYMNLDKDGLEVDGRVKMKAGSMGAANLADLPDEIMKSVQIGGENLLLNTGFLGDFDALKLNSSTTLQEGTEMYNTTLDKWNGTATLNEDSDATSGVSATIGSLSQNVSLIQNENYVISYKAKGTSFKIVVGGNTISQELTSEYQKYSHVFTNNGGTLISLSGNATFCDMKMERGTIPTDWCPSVLDPDAVKDEFKSLWYLQDAMKGSTDILGGLILSSMIQLGKWTDGVMEKVNAGVSGIYNDDTDVAVWSGGTYEEAIATVQKILSGETPSDEEWKSMAKFVATHGGDVFLRGYIYALGGVFRGTVYAQDGVFEGVVKARTFYSNIKNIYEMEDKTIDPERDGSYFIGSGSSSTEGLETTLIMPKAEEWSGLRINFRTNIVSRSGINIIIECQEGNKIYVSPLTSTKYAMCLDGNFCTFISNGSSWVVENSSACNYSDDLETWYDYQGDILNNQ
ncbi:hypothetical protein [uncultured Bacteroides sp.]|uniref:hypothetical protein n=1 Tax=uncultured Bacteroides sp. TaxID=162156 RepID=UPI00280BAB3F|nr:hypothetical protein [uncultured Bacteroides sp.]